MFKNFIYFFSVFAIQIFIYTVGGLSYGYILEKKDGMFITEYKDNVKEYMLLFILSAIMSFTQSLTFA